MPIHTAFSDARERAVREVLPAGPFRGVPTLIKDIGGHQANQRLHAGSRFLKAANCIPPGNSYVTDRLLGAGLIPLGRTNVPEFASSAASILVVTRDEVGVPNTRRFSQLVSAFLAVHRLMCSSQAQRMGATSAALLRLTFGKRVSRRLEFRLGGVQISTRVAAPVRGEHGLQTSCRRTAQARWRRSRSTITRAWARDRWRGDFAWRQFELRCLYRHRNVARCLATPSQERALAPVSFGGGKFGALPRIEHTVAVASSVPQPGDCRSSMRR